jgi:hypothetical protein
MKTNNEISNLEIIKHTIAQLDIKGANTMVTHIMTIISQAMDVLREGNPLDTKMLLAQSKKAIAKGHL